MSFHIRNLEPGQSVWGPRTIDPYEPPTPLLGREADWKWWRVESIEPEDGYSYRVEAVAEDGEKISVLLCGDLSICAKDEEGELL